MFQAGFARVDVTPPFGSPLAGNSHYRPADGILDPIELNAVAFSDGENRAVLIAADFLYVMENAATEIRKMISERCAIPAERVYMQGLHPHTSVRIGSRYPMAAGLKDEDYLSVLYRKYCDVAQLAFADLAPAEMGYAEKETAEVLSYVRRYRMKDGSVRTNPGRGNSNVLEPIGEADNTVRLVRLKRKEKGDIAIVNFSTHPDVIGGTKISADWPGFVRRHTERDLPGVKCILVNGCQGDANHVDLADVEKKKQGYAHSDHMGRVIADAVLALWENTSACPSGKVWGNVTMQYIPTNTRGMDRVDEFIARKNRIAAGLEEAPKGIQGLAELGRISTLREETLFQKVPVCALCLGKVAFVGYGGEPFLRYAEATREAGRDFHLICTCLTGGGQGYLPTPEAYGEGGYEAANSRFDSSVFELLTGEAARLLEEYRIFCR